MASLLSQRQRLLDEERRRSLQQQSRARQATVSLLVGAALLVLALTAIPLVYALRPGTAAMLATLTAAPFLAAICGAIVRNTFDEGVNWLRAAILGASAGAISFLLFTAAQLAATPEILRTDGARRLIFFVLPVGFVAGLTFDAVYAKLRAETPIDISVMPSAEKGGLRPL